MNERVWSDGQRRAFFSTFRNLVRWLPDQQQDLASRLSTLGVPTLVVWGGADRINPVENGCALIAYQPTAKLVVVPDVGHSVHQENAKAVLKEIDEWMAFA